MRIWLDPVKLAAYSLMPSDVETALESQNTRVFRAVGATLDGERQLVATVRSRSRLQNTGTVSEYCGENQTDGSVVRLSDTAG